jgi:hypothetical protein
MKSPKYIPKRNQNRRQTAKQGKLLQTNGREIFFTTDGIRRGKEKSRNKIRVNSTRGPN